MPDSVLELSIIMPCLDEARTLPARAFSWIALAGGVIACALSLYYGFEGETFMGRPVTSA